MEGAHHIEIQELLTLSAHQLVECNTSTCGCQSDNMSFAFKYILQIALQLKLSIPTPVKL